MSFKIEDYFRNQKREKKDFEVLEKYDFEGKTILMYPLLSFDSRHENRLYTCNLDHNELMDSVLVRFVYNSLWWEISEFDLGFWVGIRNKKYCLGLGPNTFINFIKGSKIKLAHYVFATTNYIMKYSFHSEEKGNTFRLSFFLTNNYYPYCEIIEMLKKKLKNLGVGNISFLGHGSIMEFPENTVWLQKAPKVSYEKNKVSTVDFVDSPYHTFVFLQNSANVNEVLNKISPLLVWSAGGIIEYPPIEKNYFKIIRYNTTELDDIILMDIQMYLRNYDSDKRDLIRHSITKTSTKKEKTGKLN